MPGRLVVSAALMVGIALVLVSPADAAPKKRTRGLIYGGSTKQDNPFVLHLARGARKISDATIFVAGTCSNGERLAYYATLKLRNGVPGFVPRGEHVLFGGKLSKRGTFRATGMGSEPLGPGTGAMDEVLAGTEAQRSCVRHVSGAHQHSRRPNAHNSGDV